MSAKLLELLNAIILRASPHHDDDDDSRLRDLYFIKGWAEKAAELAEEAQPQPEPLRITPGGSELGAFALSHLAKDSESLAKELAITADIWQERGGRSWNNAAFILRIAATHISRNATATMEPSHD